MSCPPCVAASTAPRCRVWTPRPAEGRRPTRGTRWRRSRRLGELLHQTVELAPGDRATAAEMAASRARDVSAREPALRAGETTGDPALAVSLCMPAARCEQAFSAPPRARSIVGRRRSCRAPAATAVREVRCSACSTATQPFVVLGGEVSDSSASSPRCSALRDDPHRRGGGSRSWPPGSPVGPRWSSRTGSGLQALLEPAGSRFRWTSWSPRRWPRTPRFGWSAPGESGRLDGSRHRAETRRSSRTSLGASTVLWNGPMGVFARAVRGAPARWPRQSPNVTGSP
jgi:hypothetical protein